MIALLRGRIYSCGSDHVIVDTAGGVGYHVAVPRSVLERLSAGDEVLLHTHLHVREDAMALYGFISADQLSLFAVLIGVTGVGPKVALNLLSAASPEELRSAIASEDTVLLARVPGIGKKTAARLVLELKGKLVTAGLIPAGPAASPAARALNAELAEILTSLGYSGAEAQSAVASVPADAPPDLEERLRLALQYFGTP
jgi:holliday junction DNA helicase RuvA